ncbi:membrane protein [Klebsiella pneumoniae]|uniref:Membrane protein n=1 Tax=Klebsiella pneumoniae TaxID=573 RepID=A0A377WMH5_KLEPN|nr:membrane protein [Klebsiella pneumoniae]
MRRVLEATIARFADKAENIMAWLGPAIGPQAFEVGPEVRDAFMAKDEDAHRAFRPAGENILLISTNWRGSVWQTSALSRFSAGDRCTLSEKDDFFSYRRDKTTGRMASFIWLI